MRSWPLMIVLLLMLAGCSSGQIYEAIRANRITQCQTLQGAAREDCMKPYDKSYDEYRRERDAGDNGS